MYLPITGENLANLTAEFAAMNGKFEALRERFILKEFTNARAKEYAAHGFTRRLATMVHCIKTVYRVVPPDTEGIPERDALLDATMAIQAFTFNIFGTIDNLAWVWVLESGLMKADGQPIPNTWVGLGEKNIAVRASFPQQIQEQLQEMKPWLDYVEDYRHALAHRIPLYIPPYTIEQKDGDLYNELEAAAWDALKRRDYEAQEKYEAEQAALRKFSAIISHSLPEGSRPVAFHFQMLADFNTIEQLSTRIMDAIDALPQAGAAAAPIQG
jgi:hypothetical protein